MTLAEALLLALVQGLTEFLPVSSSGHLGLAESLLGVHASGGSEIFYGILLHVATLLAVVIYFRREIGGLFAAFGRTPSAAVPRRVIALLFVATVPTAAIGLALRGLAERAFHSPPLIGAGLLLTSVLLVATRLRPATAEIPVERGWLTELATLRFREALAVGLVQGLAVWPGVSRSGSTIAAALFLGVRPMVAARFSLLVSLPAIGGGFLLELRDLEQVPADLPVQLAGFVLAFAVGLLAISWLMAAVRGAGLAWFAVWTLLVGSIGLAAGLMG